MGTEEALVGVVTAVCGFKVETLSICDGASGVHHMQVTLYSKPGCHLCEEAKAVIDRVRARFTFDFVIKDIRNDARDLAAYQYAIPVITVNDHEIARYRLTEDQLEQALTAH